MEEQVTPGKRNSVCHYIIIPLQASGYQVRTFSSSFFKAFDTGFKYRITLTGSGCKKNHRVTGWYPAASTASRGMQQRAGQPVNPCGVPGVSSCRTSPYTG